MPLKHLGLLICTFGMLCISLTPILRAEEPDSQAHKHSLAVGLPFTGLLVRKSISQNYSAEFHYIFGTDGDSDDDANAHVFGLRGYRHFRRDKRLQLYSGLEAAYILAQTRVLNANGYAAGGFAGIEYYLTRRLSLTFDAGPYYLWFKETKLGSTGGGVDFVASTSINFYIF